jgi:hypothetical protein
MSQQEVAGYLEQDANGLWYTSDFRAHDARCLSQSVPATLVAGQTQDVVVVMTNIGTATWAPAQHQLRSQNPPNNFTWGLRSVELPSSVAPGGLATFSFRIVVPEPPPDGIATFQWSMVNDGIEWYGESSPRAAVRIVRATSPTIVPSVVGMERIDAAAAIRDADLVAAFVGAGASLTIVRSQAPDAGQSVRRGATVTCQMGRE